MMKEHYIEERYQQYLHDWVNATIIFGAFFLLSPIALDYFAAPEHFTRFLGYRVLTCGVLGVLYLLNKRRVHKNYQSAIVIVGAVCVASMLSAMVFQFHGHQSPYTLGIIVLIIFCCGFAPLSLWPSLIVSVVIYGIYVIPLLLFDQITNKPFFLSSNVLMLSCMGALVLLRYLSHRRLIHEFGLQFDVDRYKDNLEMLVADRTEQLTRTITQLEKEAQDRKRAATALKENEIKYYTLLEFAPDAFFHGDSEGNVITVNDNAIELTGYPREELLTMNIADLFSSEELAAKPLRFDLLKLGKPIKMERAMKRKTGETVSVEMNSKSMPDGTFQCFARDISERTRMENILREEEQKYRSLFESANDGIFINNEAGFVDCNQRGAEMYGLTREEVIGRSVVELAPERQPDGRLSSEVAAEKMKHAMNGIPQIFEWQSIHAGGRPFDVEVTLSRVELGGTLCIQAIVRDISERKNLEYEHLKIQKLESIGTLAGGIAHDFNNLLQGVFGYISLAKMKKDEPVKSFAALEQAEKALHMAVKLTNQLLTFSKGGMPSKQAIDLIPLVQNAANFALSGSKTVYHMTADEALWQLDADEGQISQVIQNIVLNADQAMPAGGSVEIAVKNSQPRDGILPKGLQKGNYIEISVKDNGVGIPKKYLGKIFDPYFTTKETGSGLGLATSYAIVKNHNGFIIVTSEMGKGTTFTLYLPASAKAIREEQTTSRAAAAGRTGRVLVMDDEQFILDVAGELIKALGHTVEFAAHGREAVEKYQDAKGTGQPFDVAILDLTVRGGMGGAETLQKLIEIDPGVKAVMSSGYSDDALIAGYQKEGFKAVLKKPYNVDKLRDVLNMILTT